MADNLSEKIARKAERRGRKTRQTVWFGLGTMGVVGWSVVLPTLAGIALGTWVDTTYPGPHSWTLMLLALGLFLGCWNAWNWVTSHPSAESDDV